jgi:hypothetical protein
LCLELLTLLKNSRTFFRLFLRNLFKFSVLYFVKEILREIGCCGEKNTFMLYRRDSALAIQKKCVAWNSLVRLQFNLAAGQKKVDTAPYLVLLYIVTYLPHARTVGPQTQPLLNNTGTQ